MLVLLRGHGFNRIPAKDHIPLIKNFDHIAVAAPHSLGQPACRLLAVRGYQVG